MIEFYTSEQKLHSKNNSAKMTGNIKFIISLITHQINEMDTDHAISARPRLIGSIFPGGTPNQNTRYHHDQWKHSWRKRIITKKYNFILYRPTNFLYDYKMALRLETEICQSFVPWDKLSGLRVFTVFLTTPLAQTLNRSEVFEFIYIWLTALWRATSSLMKSVSTH